MNEPVKRHRTEDITRVPTEEEFILMGIRGRLLFEIGRLYTDQPKEITFVAPANIFFDVDFEKGQYDIKSFMENWQQVLPVGRSWEIVHEINDKKYRFKFKLTEITLHEGVTIPPFNPLNRKIKMDVLRIHLKRKCSELCGCLS